jgi:alkylation response protein AidB-like acyl-CoA dehydrogenase
MGRELRYHPSADQVALASTFDRSLEGLLALSRLRTAPEESEETWSGLEALGVFAIGLGEEAGGSGLGAIEEALIAMGLGRRLAAPSVFATIGATHARPAAGAALQHGRRIAAAFRSGDRIVIAEDPEADLVLVRDGAHAGLYEAAALPADPIGERLWFDRLRESRPGPGPVADLDEAGLLRLRLLDAAALAGIAEAALAMSVDFAGFREQFGRPIGMFQAVKHHCANMAIAARCARDQTSFAAVAIDDGREDAALQAECALLVAGTAALENAARCIQIHGGIGFSDEAEPHLLLKRAQLLIAIAGGLEAANIRVGDAKAGL